MVRLQTYGLLAGLAGVSGAEWSLFCPGSGIAPDSCVRVIVLLDRPAAGSALAAVAGVSTAPASGTDVSAAPAVVGAVGLWAGASTGTGGRDGVLLQALSTSAVMANSAT